jgi:radical SAM-linked protein
MARDKVRIRFKKTGDLRLVSHHDLMRCFERMLRRAELPFHSSEGFNPRARLVFAMSLALGISGTDEIAELELDDELPPEEIHRRLARQSPPGLEIVSVSRIPLKSKALVRRATFRLPLPAERREGLSERIAALLARTECWYERTRPATRRFDLRPFLHDIRLLPDSLDMDLNVTPNGAARPEEVLSLLGLDDLLRAGAVLERTRLELHDKAAATEPAADCDRVKGNA